MTHLPCLGDDAVLVDVFRRFPDTARPLLDYHQVLLRGPSPLSVAQREQAHRREAVAGSLRVGHLVPRQATFALLAPVRRGRTGPRPGARIAEAVESQA